MRVLLFLFALVASFQLGAIFTVNIIKGELAIDALVYSSVCLFFSITMFIIWKK